MKPKAWSESPGWRKYLVPAVIPAALVLLNLVLRTLWLGHRDLAQDEPFTLFYAQADFRTLFEILKSGNNPPLHFILMHFWIRFFGISPFAVRFPSMLFSTGAVYFLYRIGKDHLSVRTGILGALFFTFSNYEMQFAHEARVYPLFVFLTLLSMFLYLRMYSNPESKKTAAAYLLTGILLVYSHFFGWIVLLLQLFCSMVFREFRQRVLRKTVWGFLGVLIGFLPYFFVLITRFTTTLSTGTWVPAPVISDLYTMVWRFSNAPVTTVFFLSSMTLAFILFAVRAKSNSRVNPVTAFILVWFFLPYLLMFLVSFRLPMFLDRYLVFVSPAFFLLVARSLDYLGSRAPVYFLLSLAALSLMIATFKPDPDNNRRIKEAVLKIRELKTPGTTVFICPGWLDKGFAYYYDPEIFRDYRDFTGRLNRSGVFALLRPEQMDTNLVKGSREILYFEEWSSLVDPDHRIYTYFKDHFGSRETFSFRESFILTRFYNSRQALKEVN